MDRERYVALLLEDIPTEFLISDQALSSIWGISVAEVRQMLSEIGGEAVSFFFMKNE